MNEALTFVVAQAPPPPQDPGGQGEDFGKSSPVGLLLLILFGIAVAFLIRSMSKHLKKLPSNFSEERAAAATPARVRRAEARAAAKAGEGETAAQESEAPDAAAPEDAAEPKDGAAPKDSKASSDGGAATR